MSNAAASGGTSVATLLGVAFIVLKLTHYIDWRWRWVLAPFWIPMLFVLVIIVFIAVCFVVAHSFGGRLTVRRRK